MKTTAFLLPLFAAVSVSAHGFLATVTINGKAYTGNAPFGNGGPSVIRKISSPDPNYGTNNPALTCGPDASPASQVADANPGDTFTFDWRGADMSKWPHNTGPMLTYMASCGSSTCDEFDAGNAKWFKIQQVGRKASGDAWQQQDIMDGGVATATLPKNIAPGNYLIRHEIIALHLATARGKAEFYPACAQIRVGGTQTGKPKDNELISLPGGYSDDDPGIFDPDVYNTAVEYIFPGPPVASFIGGSTSSGGSSGGSAGSGSSSGPASPTATSPPPPKSSSAPPLNKVCKLKKQPLSSLEVNTVRPRHFKRIWRRLAFPWSH